MHQPLVFTHSTDQVNDLTASYLASRWRALSATGKPLTLFLSGGSAIPVINAAMTQLLDNTDLSNCQVRLIDERWGGAFHSDSNEHAFAQSGILELLKSLGAHWRGMLPTEAAVSGDTTAKQLSQEYQKLAQNSTTFLLAGMGADAHTAGLLPSQDQNTVPTRFTSHSAVVFYELAADTTSNPFLSRLTATPHFIQQLTEIVLFATGTSKLTALQKLLTTENPVAVPSFPVVALRQAVRPLTIYTDLAI